LWPALYLGEVVKRKLSIVVVLLLLSACSSSENSHTNEDSELLDILKANEWVSSICESHGGHPYTKHSFTVTNSALVFQYSDFEADCAVQFGEFTEIRPFVLGNELVTESGIDATEINILTKVLPPSDTEHDIKNLVYINADILYFGVTGPEIGCEPGNLRVDVTGGLGGYSPEAYVCDQRPTQIDFENYYTKKI
jgi:hypothetical protein